MPPLDTRIREKKWREKRENGCDSVEKIKMSKRELEAKNLEQRAQEHLPA
jgi:hypothetical protein